MKPKKIKILHVAQSAGGVDIYLRMLIKYLNKNKIENFLICSNDYREENYNKLVSKLYQLEMKRSIGLNDIFSTIKTRKLIKEIKPDIVYAHSSKAGGIARIANIGLKSKCIYNPHGWSFNMRSSEKKKKIYIFIEKILSNFCDRIICISDAEKDSALRNNICSSEKIKVIYNGIDVEKYEINKSDDLNREELNIPKNSFIVGMVGRISTQKAPDIFIKMAKLVKEQVTEAFFVIVGSGEQEEDIKKLASDYNLTDSLLITGWVNNPMSYVKLFDVACLLSRWEGFGLVLPEYMICEKPIVACNVDAIPNIITDKKNGLLVEVDNPKEACNAVIKLYNNNTLKHKLIKNGLLDVKNKFDAKRVSKEHEFVFENLMEIMK